MKSLIFSLAILFSVSLLAQNNCSFDERTLSYTSGYQLTRLQTALLFKVNGQIYEGISDYSTLYNLYEEFVEKGVCPQITYGCRLMQHPQTDMFWVETYFGLKLSEPALKYTADITYSRLQRIKLCDNVTFAKILEDKRLAYIQKLPFKNLKLKIPLDIGVRQRSSNSWRAYEGGINEKKVYLGDLTHAGDVEWKEESQRMSSRSLYGYCGIMNVSDSPININPGTIFSVQKIEVKSPHEKEQLGNSVRITTNHPTVKYIDCTVSGEHPSSFYVLPTKDDLIKTLEEFFKVQ